MNSKDKAFLEKFCVKESSNLIGRENFETSGFFITALLGWHSPSQKMAKCPLIRVPHETYFYFVSMKTCLWCTLLQELTIHDHESLQQAEKF